MKTFPSIAISASTVAGAFSLLASPADARCGDGLVPKPGANYCVPANSSDSDAIFRLCSSRVSHYRKIALENGWADRMDPVEAMKRCMDSKGQGM